MKRSNKLSLERKYELEKRTLSSNIEIDELNNLELNYVKKSIQLPYVSFKKFIYLFEKMSSKVDEEIFIRYLGGIFDTDSDEIRIRIKEVKAISKLELSDELDKLKKELKVEERKMNM